MDKFQSGILVITFATLGIYILLLIVDVERSSNGVIMVIFGFSISYIGSKNCLVIEKRVYPTTS